MRLDEPSDLGSDRIRAGAHGFSGAFSHGAPGLGIGSGVELLGVRRVPCGFGVIALRSLAP